MSNLQRTLQKDRLHRFTVCALFVMYGLLLCASSAPAYIGPGAGVELIGYFLGLAAWIGTAFVTLMLYPLYTLVRRLRGRKTSPAIESPPPLAAEDMPREGEARP